NKEIKEIRNKGVRALYFSGCRFYSAKGLLLKRFQPVSAILNLSETKRWSVEYEIKGSNVLFSCTKGFDLFFDADQY
ncbi:MAG: hypothetical protein OEU63_03675, partial [Gammaproteobacteria bacterium]|nr:hypothetical protein [Gammaproteobacteria bacterium]